LRGMVLVEAQAAGLKCLCSNHVPLEAALSENIEFLKLDECVWKERLLRAMENCSRSDNTSIIEIKGYSMKSQIKIVEQACAKGAEGVNICFYNKQISCRRHKGNRVVA